MFMKKIILLLCLLPLYLAAQNLQEVRGLETKKVERNVTGGNNLIDSGDFGIVFTNQNDFGVSIDATLFYQGTECDSKSFELAPKENYTWWYRIHGALASRSYYVKFKAYKSNVVIEETSSVDYTEKAANRQAETSSSRINTNTFKFEEIMPSFPGGETAFNAYLASVISDLNIQSGLGRITISFDVSKTGQMINVKIINGSLGPAKKCRVYKQIATLRCSTLDSWIKQWCSS